MELVYIETMSGISKKDNPYHLLKLANPNTFENHVVGYDPQYLDKPVFQRGQRVIIGGDLRTPFNDTKFVVTSITSAE